MLNKSLIESNTFPYDSLKSNSKERSAFKKSLEMSFLACAKGLSNISAIKKNINLVRVCKNTTQTQTKSIRFWFDFFISILGFFQFNF